MPCKVSLQLPSKFSLTSVGTRLDLLFKTVIAPRGTSGRTAAHSSRLETTTTTFDLGASVAFRGSGERGGGFPPCEEMDSRVYKLPERGIPQHSHPRLQKQELRSPQPTCRSLLPGPPDHERVPAFFSSPTGSRKSRSSRLKMPSSTSKSKPKASEVAAETRRHYIPLIKKEYSHIYKTYSYLFQQPIEQLPFDSYERPFMGPPSFCTFLASSVHT